MAWILFESGKIRDASYKAFRGNPSMHSLVKVGTRTLEVPDRDFVDLGTACLISRRFLRKQWYGLPFIRNYGHVMPPDLRGDELESHAFAHLHRSEPDTVVIHAVVTGETELSIYLRQDDGTDAIIPRDLVVQRGQLFQLPAWAIKHFDLHPITVEEVLLHGKDEDVLAAGFAVVEFTEVEEGSQSVRADKEEFDLNEITVYNDNPRRTILLKSIAVAKGLACTDLTIKTLTEFRNAFPARDIPVD